MTSRHDVNGGAHWTERLRAEPSPLPELPDHPMPLELARAYVALALAYRADHPVLVEAVHELHGGVMAAKAGVERLEQRLVDAGLLLPLRAPPLPPMRARLESTRAIARAIGEGVAERFEAEQKNPSTPPPGADFVKHAAEQLAAIEVLKIRNEALQREADDRAALDAQARTLDAERRSATIKVVVAFILTSLAIIGALAEHFAR